MATAGAIASKTLDATNSINQSIEAMSEHLGLNMNLSPTFKVKDTEHSKAVKLEHLAKVLNEIKAAVIRKVPKSK